MPANFDTAALSELEEMLGYERYVLRKCVALNANTLGFDLPLQMVFHDNTPIIDVIHCSECSASEADVTETIQELSPLIFCAGYKLLDMVVEWTLSQNGIHGPRGRLTFKQKKEEIHKPAVMFPGILDSELILRERFISLYDSLAETRNAITHRKWGVSRGGNLHLDFEKTDVSPRTQCRMVIPFQDVLRFGEVLSDLADALLSPNAVTPRMVLVMTSKLNALGNLHTKGRAPANVPRLFYATRRTTQQPPFTVDIERIRQRVSEQARGGSFEIDLQIEVERDDGRRVWRIPAQFVPCEDFVLNEQWERFESL